MIKQLVDMALASWEREARKLIEVNEQVDYAAAMLAHFATAMEELALSLRRFKVSGGDD